MTKNTWTGAGGNNNWNTSANWSAGHYPGQDGYTSDDVLIPDEGVASDNYPVLSSDIQIKSLEIDMPTASFHPSVTAGTYNITVTGTTGAWINNGTFVPGTGKVIFVSGTKVAITTVSGITDFNDFEVGANTFLQPATGSEMKIGGILTADGSSILDFSANDNTVEYTGTLSRTIINPAGPDAEFGYNCMTVSTTSGGVITFPSVLNIAGDFTNNGSVNTIANASTVIMDPRTIAHANTISGTSSTVFNNLTINNSDGVTATANFEVDGELYLQSANASDVKGSLDVTDSYKLSLGIDATTTGIGDVTGIVRRAHTFIAGTSYTFNHQFTTMILSGGGTFPTAMENKLKIGTAPSWKPLAVKRTDDWIREGAGTGSYLKIASHYLDSELQGNDEVKIVRWKYVSTGSPTVSEVGRSANSTSDNWVANANIDVATKINTAYGWERTYANSMLASLTWNGSLSTTFSDQNNWTPNGTPGSSSVIIIPDASFTPNDPVLTATQSISTLSIENGGVLNSGNYTLTVAGTIGAWQNAGTFNAGTGTVVFSGNGADLSGTTDFYHLTINASARLATQAGAVIGISGAVTISGTDGNRGIWSTVSSGNTTVNYKGESQTVVIPDASTTRYNNLILSGSGTKTMPASALSIKGDFTLSGTASVTAAGSLTIAGNTVFASGTTFDAGSFIHNLAGNLDNNGATMTTTGSTFNLNGAAPQTLGGTSASTFDNLTLNNAAGVSLGSATTISGTLTLTSGKLTLGNHHLNLNTTTAIAGTPAGSNYIVYSGSGILVKYIPATMETAYLFPIGTAANYSPATFKLNSGTVDGTSTLELNLTEGKQPNIVAANYINRYWTITPTGTFTSPNYDATFTYLDGDIVGNETSIKSAKYSSDWTQYALTTVASNLLSIAGATSFSDYTGFNDLVATQAIATKALTISTAYEAFTPVTASGGTGTLAYALKNSDNSGVGTLPTGMSFNTASGEISGTATATLAATTYTVLVTDVPGAVDSKTFELTVKALPAAPEAVNVSVIYDGLSHTGSATAPSGASVVWYDALTGGSITSAPSLTNVGTQKAWAESVDDVTGGKSSTRSEVTVEITARGLTITANDVHKPYGTAITGAAGSTAFASVGLQHSETIGTVTIAYGTGASAMDPVATNAAQVTPSLAVDGTFTASNYAITYAKGAIIVDAVPTITSFTPTMAATGATVTITGTNFTGATVVSFGGTASTSYSVVGATSITAVVAGGATGSVSVTTSGGTATRAGFTFLTSASWIGTTSTDWNTATNWSTGLVPTYSDNATIPDVTNDPIIGAASVATEICNNLTIQSGAVLTISAGKALTVNGNLVNATGTTGLVVKSDASGTGSLKILGSTSASATVERIMAPAKWHIVSAPAIEDLSTFLLRNLSIPFLATDNKILGMKDYNTTDNSWNSSYTTSTSGIMNIGKGYLVRTEAVASEATMLDFKGPLNAGNKNVTVSLSGTKGWNCIGNPYTSAIKFTNGTNDPSGLDNFLDVNSSNIDATSFGAYIFTGSGSVNGYAVINYATSEADRYASLGQGFFVKAASNGATISFTPGMQVHKNDADAPYKSAEKPTPKIKLSVASGMVNASTDILFIDGTTKGLDKGYDAGILKADPSFALYTKLVDDIGAEFQLQCLPTNQYDNLVVPIGIDSKAGGEIVFTVETVQLVQDCKVILEDRLTNTFIDLSTGNYKVAIAANTAGTGRFYLHTGELISGVEDQVLPGKVTAYAKGNKEIHVIGEVGDGAVATLYNGLGKVLLTKKLGAGTLNIIGLPNLASGVYLLNINDKGTAQTIKMMIRK